MSLNVKGSNMESEEEFVTNSNKGAIFYVGLRHLEALRESLIWGLSGNAIHDSKKTDILDWLKSQQIKNLPAISEHKDETNLSSHLISTALSMEFHDATKEGLGALAQRYERPELASQGAKRSGAGWKQTANFITTSAFVRLLGALEQFEMDVLKALFHYRPKGLSYERTDEETTQIENDIFMEIPKKEKDDLIYSKPVIWTWIRKHAENNVERRKIFKKVFGLTLGPEGTNAEKKEWNKKKDGWYENRNAIAHGREGVIMNLHNYSEVEVYCYLSMKSLAQQCEEKYNIKL